LENDKGGGRETHTRERQSPLLLERKKESIHSTRKENRILGGKKKMVCRSAGFLGLILAEALDSTNIFIIESQKRSEEPKNGRYYRRPHSNQARGDKKKRETSPSRGDRSNNEEKKKTLSESDSPTQTREGVRRN